LRDGRGRGIGKIIESSRISNVPKKTCDRRSRERGTVLVMSLTIIVVVMILAMPILLRLATQPGITEKGFEAVSALCLAEAGVEKAVWELNRGTWVKTENLTASLTMAISDHETPEAAIIGDIGITVMPFDGATGTRLVEATGRVRLADFSRFAKTVRVVLKKADEYVIASWSEL
jgi:hypothetical protein